jgi:hypothetical protein
MKKATIFQRQQLKEMLALAMSMAMQKGRVKVDKAAFVETILMAVTPDVTWEKQAALSVRLCSELLGMPVCTAMRRGLKVHAKKWQRLIPR